jgi:hypothetical protein
MCHGSVLNYKDLAAILKISPETLRKNWRSYPHFFVGQGKDLRSARFDGMDVLDYLKKEKKYEQLMEIPDKKWGESLSGQIPLQGSASGQGRIHITEGGTGVGEGRKKAVKRRGRTESGDNPSDPYDLFSLIK